MTTNDQMDGEERAKGAGRVPLAKGSGNPNHDRADQIDEAPVDADPEAIKKHSREHRDQVDEQPED